MGGLYSPFVSKFSLINQDSTIKMGFLTGDIVKCNSTCERCSRCKIDSSNNSELENKYRTIYPEDPIDIDKIVINNISKLDIENIL